MACLIFDFRPEINIPDGCPKKVHFDSVPTLALALCGLTSSRAVATVSDVVVAGVGSLVVVVAVCPALALPPPSWTNRHKKLTQNRETQVMYFG